MKGSWRGGLRTFGKYRFRRSGRRGGGGGLELEISGGGLVRLGEGRVSGRMLLWCAGCAGEGRSGPSGRWRRMGAEEGEEECTLLSVLED